MDRCYVHDYCINLLYGPFDDAVAGLKYLTDLKVANRYAGVRLVSESAFRGYRIEYLEGAVKRLQRELDDVVKEKQKC